MPAKQTNRKNKINSLVIDENITMFDFYDKLRQHCKSTAKQSQDCVQCCLRYFCSLAPTSINKEVLKMTLKFLKQAEMYHEMDGHTELSDNR